MYAVILIEKHLTHLDRTLKVTEGWFEMVSEGHVNIEDAKEWIGDQPEEERDKYRIIRFY